MKIIVFITSIVAAATLFSSEQPVDLAGLNDMQRFYYEQGFSDASQVSYEKGYHKATQDFKEKVLVNYANRIKAIEAGKYLTKEGKITYPKVFRIKDGSGYKVHIEAPVVEKEFTEKDLFMLPAIETTITLPSSTETSGQEDIPANGFAIPSRDDVKFGRDSAPEVRKERVVAHIPYKNEGIEQAINSNNIDHASTKDGYDLFFSNEAEKNDFCIKITGNQKCAIN
jgi:hypothetical protein